MRGRRASLLLSLLMTAALIYLLPGIMSGLGSGDGNRMDERLRPARMRTLTVWLMPGGVNDRKLLNQACAAFEKQQSGVRVFLRTVTAEEWTAADAVLPDVALLATGSLNIPERVLVPLAGIEEAGASGRSGGVTYALPLWLEANVLSFPTAWIASASTAQPTPSALLASPPPERTDSGMIAAEDLPWRKLLEPGVLALPEGVALQQLMFLCPVQIRGELAALGERPEGAEVPGARVHAGRAPCGRAGWGGAYRLSACTRRERSRALCRDCTRRRGCEGFRGYACVRGLAGSGRSNGHGAGACAGRGR